MSKITVAGDAVWRLVRWFRRWWVYREGTSLHRIQVMTALTFCCCALALAIGASTAASPEGHNPVRAYVDELVFQH